MPRAQLTGPSPVDILEEPLSHLKLWCRVADVDMNAILRTYCQGEKSARLVGDVK